MGTPRRKTRAAGVNRPRRTLPRRFFAIDAASLARSLLGQRLVRELADGTHLAGIIVETEAYMGVPDRASHAFGGRRTPRNEAMYAEPGTAYVYFTYGMHFCVNVVGGAKDDPQAVLIRAVEPTEGIGTLRALRSHGAGRSVPDRDLCRGPARLCQAFSIDRALNGHDLVAGERLWLEPGPGVSESLVRRSARIGVAYAGSWAARRLRWFVRGNPHVSGRANPPSRAGRTASGSSGPGRLLPAGSQS